MNKSRVSGKSPIRILLNKMSSVELDTSASPQGLRAILLKILRRLDEGDRVEGRLIYGLEVQGEGTLPAKSKAMLDELRMVFDNPQVPLAPSRYAAWAQEHEALLASARDQVELLLSSIKGAD
jgi:hypothetical protein